MIAHSATVSDLRDRWGGKYVAAGILIAAVVLVSAHLINAINIAPDFPPNRSPWPAWILLMCVLTFGISARLTLRHAHRKNLRSGELRLPQWLIVTLFLGDALVVIVDVSSTWGMLEYGITPTAAAAVGAVMMPTLTVHSSRAPVIVAGTTALVLAVTAVMQIPEAGTLIFIGLAIAVSAVLPVFVVTVIVDRFSNLVDRDLDLTFAQSMIYTPHEPIGIAASKELLHIDSEAEAFLAAVGSGELELPLAPNLAAEAGELAKKLRSRLIMHHSETWLKLAVSESLYLADRVLINDASGQARLLNHDQRDALLVTLWLIAGGRKTLWRTPPNVVLSFHQPRIQQPDKSNPSAQQLVSLSLEIQHKKPQRIDRSAWVEIDKLGPYIVVQKRGLSRVEIDCRVTPVNRGTVPAIT